MANDTATTMLSDAIDVFARGFSFTRSMTHPYVAHRVGALWVLRDAPRRSGPVRSEEWVAHVGEGGQTPAQADRVVRTKHQGRFTLCAIHAIGEPDGPLRAAFKELGYRLRATEPLMVHGLERIPRLASPASIERVTTPEMADRLARAAGSRQILPEFLDRPDLMRQYVALLGGEVAGWVRSIVVGDAGWCSNMYVERQFRRRGIARSLLARMLRDDRAGGARSAVLLASHAGAKLYPIVGYRQIGTLLLYSPAKKGQ